MAGTDDPESTGQPTGEPQPGSPVDNPLQDGQPQPYGQAPAYGQVPPYGQPPVPGQPYPYQPYAAAYPYGVPQAGNGIAVAALVLGIAGIVFSTLFVPGVLAFIFGFVGMNRASQRDGAGHGMAIAGVVLGIISVILGVVIWVLIVGAGQGTCTINGSPC